MKTLFVSDLDGTLLTAEERISAYSLQNLNRLIDDDGLQFTYATARSLNSAAKALWGLRQNLPVVLYNGAVVMEPWSGKMLYNNHFNRGQLDFLRDLFARHDVWPLVYSFRGTQERVSWVEDRATAGVRRYLARRAGDPRFRPVASRDELVGDDIFYFNCISAKENLDGLYEEVLQHSDLKCIFERETYHTDYWCEIMPAGTSKGEGALRVKELLGADRLVVFGDALDPQVLHPYMWMCKVHYYIPEYHYYNYPYIFGLLLAKGLYARYLAQPDGFPQAYRQLLAATCSGSMEDIAAKAGVDIRSQAFWDSALDLIVKDIDAWISWSREGGGSFS